MSDPTDPIDPPEPTVPTEPGGATAPTEPGGAARSRRSLVVAVVGLVVLAVVAVFLFVGGDDDDDDDGGSGISGELPDAPTLPPPVSGDVSAEAEELIALLDRGADARYHAVYSVSGDPSVIGGEMSLEVWRDGGRSRRDTHVVSEGGSADTVGIEVDGTAISCNRIDGADWTCFEVPAEDLEDDVVGSVRSQLTGAEVTPRDDEIDGRAVRCFAYGTADGPAEICVTDEGVVVRLAAGETALELTALDADVPGEVFSPPAELSDPPAPPDDEG